MAEEDEGLLAWISKHKAGTGEGNLNSTTDTKKQKEKDIAKRTARMLDDTDRLVEEQESDDEQNRNPRKKVRRGAKSNVVVPSVIAHRPEFLQEGEVVMVLKDAPVLAGADGLNEGTLQG